MAGSSESKWKWLERINILIALATPLVGVTASVAGYVVFELGQRKGVKSGQQEQARSLDLYLDSMIESAPASQRERLVPVIKTFKEAIRNVAADQDSKSNVSQSVRDLTNAITSISSGRYSSGNARIFSVPEDKVALMCDDKHFINYRGLWRGSMGRYEIVLDGRFWVSTPGEQTRLANRVIITFMEVRERSAIFDVNCG